MNTDGVPASGAWTPMATIQNNARETAAIVGDAAKRMAGDFTGRKIKLSNHPRKVVSELLRTTQSAQVLARRLFRTYAGDSGDDLLRPQDLRYVWYRWLYTLYAVPCLPACHSLALTMVDLS